MPGKIKVFVVESSMLKLIRPLSSPGYHPLYFYRNMASENTIPSPAGTQKDPVTGETWMISKQWSRQILELKQNQSQPIPSQVPCFEFFKVVCWKIRRKWKIDPSTRLEGVRGAWLVVFILSELAGLSLKFTIFMGKELRSRLWLLNSQFNYLMIIYPSNYPSGIWNTEMQKIQMGLYQHTSISIKRHRRRPRQERWT